MPPKRKFSCVKRRKRRFYGNQHIQKSVVDPCDSPDDAQRSVINMEMEEDGLTSPVEQEPQTSTPRSRIPATVRKLCDGASEVTSSDDEENWPFGYRVLDMSCLYDQQL